jgi:excinuclease ABC subunit A
MEVIHRLVDQGNTVVMIEHNLDVLLQADRLIDLGPEGGDRGGKVVAVGSPEEVAENPRSYTGQYLKELFERRRKGRPRSRRSRSREGAVPEGR